MALKGSGRGKLAELVADHVLGDVDRDVLSPVVDGDGVTNEGGEDGGGSGPGLQNLLFTGLVQLFIVSLKS